MKGGRRGRLGQRLRDIRPLNTAVTPTIKEIVLLVGEAGVTEWPTNSLSEFATVSTLCTELPLPPPPVMSREPMSETKRGEILFCKQFNTKRL